MKMNFQLLRILIMKKNDVFTNLKLDDQRNVKKCKIELRMEWGKRLHSKTNDWDSIPYS